jgi:hypothetical protein
MDNYCSLCNIDIQHEKNYIRHCNTKLHLKKEEINFKCEICNKQYKTIKVYKTHRNKYHNKINKNIDNKLEDIRNDIKNDIKNNIEDVKNNINDVKEEINKSNEKVVTVVNKAINKASSLIKYLMEHHRGVPPLKKITKQQCIPMLRLDYDCPEKDNDYSLQKLFIKDHTKNLFVPNISKSILKMINYQNKDNQPIYNTDSTRYNYVVKLTTDLWNEDKSGIKFTDYIIKPLLRYVRELVEEYIEEDLEKINMYKNSSYENEQLLDKKEEAYTFDIALTNDYLIKPILKELSPYLRFLQLELEEMEKLEELEKIQEDLQEIINNNSDNNSYKSDNSDSDDFNDNYIKKINRRIIK